MPEGTWDQTEGVSGNNQIVPLLAKSWDVDNQQMQPQSRSLHIRGRCEGSECRGRSYRRYRSEGAQLGVSWHTHYVFHLADQAVFSDGTPVTAKDVKLSFRRLIGAKSIAAGGAYSIYWLRVSGVAGLGEREREHAILWG